MDCLSSFGDSGHIMDDSYTLEDGDNTDSSNDSDTVEGGGNNDSDIVED